MMWIDGISQALESKEIYIQTGSMEVKESETLPLQLVQIGIIRGNPWLKIFNPYPCSRIWVLKGIQLQTTKLTQI